MTLVCCCPICLVLCLILLVVVLASAFSLIMSYAIMIWDKITGRKDPQPYLYPQPLPQKAYYCKNCGRQLGYVGEDRWYCYACGSYTCYGAVKKKTGAHEEVAPKPAKAPAMGKTRPKQPAEPAKAPATGEPGPESAAEPATAPVESEPEPEQVPGPAMAPVKSGPEPEHASEPADTPVTGEPDEAQTQEEDHD